jgi:hypothetical protein
MTDVSMFPPRRCRSASPSRRRHRRRAGPPDAGPAGGGKRRLGESTLSCAVSEAEEECSLIVDWGRLGCGVPERYGGVGLGVKGDGGEEGVGVDGDGRRSRRRGGDARGGDAVVRVLASRGRDCHDAFLVMTQPPPPSPICRVARDIVITRLIRAT